MGRVKKTAKNSPATQPGHSGKLRTVGTGRA
jgi:hypothetical protein